MDGPDFLTRFKVKHLVWIPVIGFIQIYFLWHYANKADHIRKAKDAFLAQHFEDAEKWRSEYLVHFDYAVGTYETESGVDAKDVTLVSQCSPDNLHHIEGLMKAWKGPISIAVFSPDRDAVSAMFGIQILRKCNADIRRHVTFHIMYPSSHPPRFDETVDDFTEEECSIAMGHLKESEGKNYARGELPYPQNSLRNIARVKIKTDLFYLVDIDTVPSNDLRYQFTKFAKKRGLLDQTRFEAFITPAFEIRSHHNLPASKDNVIRLIDAGEMRPFHYDTCPYCHKPTEFDHWYGYRGSDELEDAFEVEYSNSFEPFYLANTHAAPLHDERFKAYGFDRISQICEMHVKGFTFYVLNNAFITHKGFKFKKNFHETKDYENKKNSKIYEKYFKPELKVKYKASERECLEASANRRGHVQVNVDNLKQILKRGVEQHIQIENTRERTDPEVDSQKHLEREKLDSANRVAEQEKTEPVSDDDSEIEEDSEEEKITPENDVALDNEEYEEIKSSPAEANQLEDETEDIKMLSQNDEPPAEVNEDLPNENEVDSDFLENEEESEMNSESLDESENELAAEIETRNVRLLGREEEN